MPRSTLIGTDAPESGVPGRRSEHHSRPSASLWGTRRGFLRGAAILGLGSFGSQVVRVPAAHALGGGADSFGPLGPPDGNGLRLPPGFSSRVVAVTGSLPVATSSYLWHGAPDGGACFATRDGGWVYVSNAELGSGGAGALRFASDGTLVDAYPILSGTAANCAGGATPWGTWLSCEEHSHGHVWECDPFARYSQGVKRAALGQFPHEAVAVDPVRGALHLTEDTPDGLLYRFTPAGYPGLDAGTLEALQVLDPLGQGPIQPGQVRPLAWHVVPLPNPGSGTPTRFQVPAATPFNGGEGCWYQSDRVYFTTKGDGRVYLLDAQSQTLRILYDQATSADPELQGVDNVTGSPLEDVYVAEDGGNMEIVALTAGGDVKPVIQLTGVSGSEMTGPALSPDGLRMYFSSQRNPGATYEVSGPWTPIAPVPALRAPWAALLALALGAGLWLRQRTKPTTNI